MNWKKIIAIGLTGCFLFSGCAEQRQNAQKMGEEGTQEDSYESTTFAMDTVMTFHIVAPDGEDLLIDAEQEVKRLEKLFSVTDEDSDIEQINDNAGDKAVTVSADTLALLKAGKNVLPGNFIEGMACVGGCIGGAGCLTHGEKDKTEVDKYGKEAFEKTISDAIGVL